MKQLLILFLGAMLGISQAQALPITYTAVLSGLNENPPNASPGTGFATVTIDDVAHLLLVNVNFAGLVAGNTAAHIHCCAAPPGNVGVATPTPTFPGFPTGATAGTYDNSLFPLDLTLASSFNGSFLTNNGGTPAGAEAALAAGLAAGQAYFNIHSSVFPGGEIRGFLTAVVPEIDAASGTGALVLLGGMLVLVKERRRRA